MKFSKKLFLTAAIMCGCFLSVSSQAATVDNMIEKLGRGIANVAFGPLEIIIRPYDVTQEDGGIAGLTKGVITGVVFVVVREVVGVTDIVTFPMPLPGCTEDPKDVGWGYGPMLRPAWVVDREHNAFNFFFEDDTVATGR